MGVFVIGSLALVLLAIFILYVPFKKAQKNAHSRRDINQRLVQERLNEIEKENLEGLLSHEDKNLAQNELKLAFVDEQEDLTLEPKKVVKNLSRVALILIFIVGSVLSVGVYWQVNELDDLNHWLTIGESSKTLQAKLETGTDLTREDLIDISLGVRTKLIANPEDAIAWQWLGRIYTSLQRPDMAIDAMEKAVRLQPSDPVVLESFARVLLLQGTPNSFERAKSVLFRLLDVDPEHQNALAMLGLAAEQLGDIQLATDAWKAVKEQLKQDDPFNQIVDRQLAKLGQPVDPVVLPSSNTNNESDEENVEIQLTISVSEELLEKSGQLPYLFVFAQDGTTESRVPAAVIRMPVESFPVEISLNNSHAMVPGFNLSSLEQARLIARLSVDENVATQSGELEGELHVVVSKDKVIKHSIVIDKELL